MANNLCIPCWRWGQFKTDCHFHWEGKRECSRFLEHQLDVEKYMTIVDSSYLF
ncbi:hypothetical protein GOV08_05585 [Candidatus Woesearchaeota archaeon]|nr:hypothetical protein [Candidatus Woesearchaeota archaeon]